MSFFLACVGSVPLRSRSSFMLVHVSDVGSHCTLMDHCMVFYMPLVENPTPLVPTLCMDYCWSNYFPCLCNASSIFVVSILPSKTLAPWPGWMYVILCPWILSPSPSTPAQCMLWLQLYLGGAGKETTKKPAAGEIFWNVGIVTHILYHQGAKIGTKSACSWSWLKIGCSPLDILLVCSALKIYLHMVRKFHPICVYIYIYISTF